jgi:rhomboid family protein
MGIYDRDYYRKEGPSYLDSFALRGQATKWLLIVTICVFILQLVTRVQTPRGWQPGVVTNWLVLKPELVMHGEVWRLVTYAFLHSDGTGFPVDSSFWTHIVFNMWLLFVFGHYVEDIYGRWEFMAFYLTAALVGGLAYTAEYYLMHKVGMCLGASGAVTAVLILCALYHPRLNILLFFVIPVPVWLLAVFQVAQDVLGFLGGGDRNTAFSVHLGGAAFAFLYFKGHVRILSFWDQLRTWKKQRARPRLRVYHPDDGMSEPVPVGPTVGAEIDEQFEAKVDAVLAKVARTGKESLTDAEQQLLLKASEIYKRRRT